MMEKEKQGDMEDHFKIPTVMFILSSNLKCKRKTL